jgi:hypothetical protein
MIRRVCTICGRLTADQTTSRCDLHPKRWRSGSTRRWRQTRERILERDGHRCTATDRLEVHHIFERGSNLIAPDDELVTRCFRHNPRGC